MDEIFSNVKLVIIGEPTVGKTSLRRSYIGEAFKSNYIETIGSDFSFTSLEIENTTIGLSLWDLAGQEKFLKIHPLFYKGAYGCIVVFSVVDRESFNTVEDWVHRFLAQSTRNEVPVLVIGNKKDLLHSCSDPITIEEQTELVERLSKKYPKNEFSTIRTSAKSGDSVHEGLVKFAYIVYSWILERQNDDTSNIIYEEDINQNIPGAYLLVMNQIVGPQVLSIHPPSQNSKLLGEINNSAVKLIASLDFNDIISHSSIISSFPWTNPRGLFHYIAFVVDNKRARGKKELFILGVNINRNLTDPVYGIKGVLDGILYNSLNKFVRLITEHEIDFTTKITEIAHTPEIENQTLQLLNDMRLKTDESIKRWYNIPK